MGSRNRVLGLVTVLVCAACSGCAVGIQMGLRSPKPGVLLEDPDGLSPVKRVGLVVYRNESTRFDQVVRPSSVHKSSGDTTVLELCTTGSAVLYTCTLGMFLPFPFPWWMERSDWHVKGGVDRPERQKNLRHLPLSVDYAEVRKLLEARGWQVTDLEPVAGRASDLLRAHVGDLDAICFVRSQGAVYCPKPTPSPEFKVRVACPMPIETCLTGRVFATQTQQPLLSFCTGHHSAEVLGKYIVVRTWDVTSYTDHSRWDLSQEESEKGYRQLVGRALSSLDLSKTHRLPRKPRRKRGPYEKRLR